MSVFLVYTKLETVSRAMEYITHDNLNKNDNTHQKHQRHDEACFQMFIQKLHTFFPPLYFYAAGAASASVCAGASVVCSAGYFSFAFSASL